MMQYDRSSCLTALRDWAGEFLRNSGFSSVFLFGSLVHLDGVQFRAGESDVDLVWAFRPDIKTPDQRVKTILSALDFKRALEGQLIRLLGRPDAHKNIVSVVAATDFELSYDIHKSGDFPFFGRSEYINLTGFDRIHDVSPLRSVAECAKISKDAKVVIEKAQAFRSKVLSIGFSGPPAVSNWDHPSDPLPKEMCRAAARLKAFLHPDTRLPFDMDVGLEYAHSVVQRYSDVGESYLILARWLTARRGGREQRAPLTPEHHLLLWETLAADAIRQIISHTELKGDRAAWTIPDVATHTGDTSWPSEESYLKTVTERPSVKIGGLDLRSAMLPELLWTSRRQENLFLDDPESINRVQLDWFNIAIPPNALDKLVDELTTEVRDPTVKDRDSSSQSVLKEIHRRLTEEGSNAYPRIVGLPVITPDLSTPGKTVLHIPIAPSRYGIALIEERKVALPTAVALRSKHVLNSLAVRTALIYRRAGKWVLECHQRKPKYNATYEEAWDVGAAGYVDFRRHRDPEDPSKISPWQTAAHELQEELGLSPAALPYRDNYYFFGLGRDAPTGQISVLGVCESPEPPDSSRVATERVSAYDSCDLTPDSTAGFILAKKKWVPTAIMTVILILQMLGFTSNTIEQAFSRLEGKLELEP